MSDTRALESVLGYRFSDPTLLELALVHSSMRVDGRTRDNEVLEFLGDAVLDLAVSELLIEAHPGLDEGRLTRLRAGLVNAQRLAELGRAMDIGSWLQLGKGEVRSGGSDKDRILAAAVEALFGAVFRDADYPTVRTVISRLLAEDIANRETSVVDAKTELQQLTQEHFKTTPDYEILEISGPDHERSYRVEVRLETRTLAEGEAPNRKQAEQNAAHEALAKLRTELNCSDGGKVDS